MLNDNKVSDKTTVMTIFRYTKEALIALIILFVNISCISINETKTNQIATEVVEEKPINLVGKTLEYNYGNTVYEVSFKSNNQLHWKCTKGDELGQEADEIYFTHRLSNHTLFISWIESNGLGVSQVLNLKENVVDCFLKIDKEVISLSGKIQEL